MKLFSLSKFVNIPNFKSLDPFTEIIEVKEPKLMVYSLTQQHNMSCTPVVKRRDEVLKGQVIGESENKSVGPIYSSVSGKVKQITTEVGLDGDKYEVVVIENDGLYKELEREKIDYKSLSFEQLKEHIKNLGLVETQNLTTRKRGLHIPFKKACKNILLNAQESGLYGQIDTYLFMAEKEDFLNGIEILRNLYKDADIKLLTTNDETTVKGFSELLKETNVEIVPKKPTQYYHDINLASRDVFSDFNMKDTMVLDAFMLPALARGIRDNELTHYQYILVNGNDTKKPGIYKVINGSQIKDLQEASESMDPFRMVGGSILSGDAIYSLDTTIDKGIREILFLSKDEVARDEEINCIKCGRCQDICPMNLKPWELNEMAINRDFDDFFKNRGGMCVECGLCSYVCPSKRHLLQSFKTAKKASRG